MPGLPIALSAPAGPLDVGCGLLLLATACVAAARGRGALLLAVAAVWLAGDLVGPPVASPATSVALGAVVVLAARTPATRGAAAAAIGGSLALAALADGADAAAAWGYDVAIVTSAVGTAVSGWGAGRAAATGLVVDLASGPQALRAALARAIGDPGVTVAYRTAEGWVDEAGVAVPEPGPDRVARRIDDSVLLVHDPAALRDEGLARSVDAALRLALANVRLQDAVAQRVTELERSRRRLVEAAADERQRLSDQLRDGAERHLDASAVALTGHPLREAVDAAAADLRRFAQGIHPRALTEHGLAAALAELAGSARLDVSAGRFERAQETAAYFVCSEALANAGKHAPEAQVSISVRADDRRLRVQVRDDGPGGADPHRGSGLRGLADRVEALGGQLRVDSPPGGGTTVEAVL